MGTRILVLGTTASLALLAGPVPRVAGEDSGGAKTAYLVKGERVDACECDIYCPCLFEYDATRDQCRALIVWKVGEGRYGDVDLKGLAFAASITKSGKNLGKALGHLEGVAFVPEQGTAEQRAAIESLLKAELGGAFAKLEVRTAAVSLKGEPGKYEAMVGKDIVLSLTALKGANGKVPMLENPPDGFALAKNYYAKTDAHTYNDGSAKWDFAGRHACYGDFELKSKEAAAK